MSSATADARRGQTARAAGASAEEIFVLSGDVYARDGRALLRRRPTPWHIVSGRGRDGLWRAVPGGQQGPDFDLHRPGARGGLLELKSTSAKTLRARAGGQILTPVQLAELRLADALGLVAGVVVATSAGWWVCPVERIAHASLAGALSPATLDACGVRCASMSGALPDWLPAVGALWEGEPSAAWTTWCPQCGPGVSKCET